MHVDIHAHILPGCDDGADDTETAISMLQVAAHKGTGHIISTPHLIPGTSHIEARNIAGICRKLQSLSDAKGMNIRIYPGCEAFLSPELPDMYDAGLICTLANTKYILVEMPMMSIPPYTDEVLYKLQLKGLIPVLAHPERNREIVNNPENLKKFMRRDVLVQINSGSLTGLYGEKVKKLAHSLVSSGSVHFVASDAHSTGIQRPNLDETEKIIKKKYGDAVADLLLRENGVAVIGNRAVRSLKTVHIISRFIFSK